MLRAYLYWTKEAEFAAKSLGIPVKHNARGPWIKLGDTLATIPVFRLDKKYITEFTLHVSFRAPHQLVCGKYGNVNHPYVIALLAQTNLTSYTLEMSGTQDEGKIPLIIMQQIYEDIVLYGNTKYLIEKHSQAAPVVVPKNVLVIADDDYFITLVKLLRKNDFNVIPSGYADGFPGASDLVRHHWPVADMIVVQCSLVVAENSSLPWCLRSARIPKIIFCEPSKSITKQQATKLGNGDVVHVVDDENTLLHVLRDECTCDGCAKDAQQSNIGRPCAHDVGD